MERNPNTTGLFFYRWKVAHGCMWCGSNPLLSTANSSSQNRCCYKWWQADFSPSGLGWWLPFEDPYGNLETCCDYICKLPTLTYPTGKLMGECCVVTLWTALEMFTLSVLRHDLYLPLSLEISSRRSQHACLSWLCRLQGCWEIAELSWAVLICGVPQCRQLPWWAWCFGVWFV